MRCEICDTEIPVGATECPHCGFEVSWMQAPQSLEKKNVKENISGKIVKKDVSIESKYQSELTISFAIKRAAIFPIVLGIILIAASIFIPVPGGALTTYSWMDGESAETFEFDNRYSVIDEYVGGDAYNYIIGASLVAGKISGYIAGKAAFLVAGGMCVCLGIIMIVIAGGIRRAAEKNTK